MRKLIVVLLLLTGCHTFIGKPQPIDKNLKVYQGEYVVEAKGAWCPWAPGVRSCPIIFGEGVFLVDEAANVKLVKIGATISSEPQIIPYDPQEDLCLTQFKDEECSPNWAISIEKDNEPNDPLYPQLWGMKNSDALKAWGVTNNTERVTVAILDTGIECDHPDIKGSCTGELNAITGETGNGKGKDDNGHGTHVSGTVCAHGDNGIGVTGVSWDCKLLAVKFLGANGGGSLFDAIKGIDYAVQQGARVINASWGGGGYSQPLYNAIARARDADVLFVAAAGNDGLNNDIRPSYPSGYDLDNIISVASIDENNTRSRFSNYGKDTVDLAAPGGSILSTYKGGVYKSLSGTSMATPHVSGALALISERYPTADYQWLKEEILSKTRANEAVSDIVKSGGNLNVYGAVTGEEPPPQCMTKKFKQCIKSCNEKYECKFLRQKKCRGECEVKYNCNDE